MTDNRETEEKQNEESAAEGGTPPADSDAIDDLFLDPDSDASEVEFEPDASTSDDAAETSAVEGRAATPTSPPPAASSAEFEAVSAERDDLKNRLLRTAADLENFRKRTSREKEELRKYGIDRVVLELLPVLDNLERALEHADKAENASSVIDGVKMVQRQFVGALQKHGVQGFESKGTEFDPQKHEAIQQVESEEYPTGTVVEEYQKGYYLHDRLIRPAMVVVARNTAPAKPAPPDTEAEEDSGDTAAPTPDESAENSTADAMGDDSEEQN